MHLSSEVKVYQFNGIPKRYFNCIIQYLYSDHFFISEHTIDFFLDLLQYADYFMIDRLKAIAAFYVQQYLTLNNLIDVFKMSQRHNSAELEQYCLQFVCLIDHDSKELTASDRLHLASIKMQCEEASLCVPPTPATLGSIQSLAQKLN